VTRVRTGVPSIGTKWRNLARLANEIKLPSNLEKHPPTASGQSFPGSMVAGNGYHS
jgi:hypothetical protein